MQEKITRLVQSQSDWHIVELMPTSLDVTAEPNTVDLVVCDRVSAYCSDMSGLLAQVASTLVPGGQLAVVDTLVPGSRLRGKKAALRRRAGEYVNAMMRLCEGGNGRNLSLEEWQDALRVANITITHQEPARCKIAFDAWVAEANVPAITRTRLRALLRQAPEPVAAFLTPQSANDRITFYLTEAIFVGRLEFGD